MPIETEPPWAKALGSRRFQLLTVGTFAVLIAALLALNTYLQFNEQRAGVTLSDPVLARLPALDLSWPLFLLIYGSLTLTVATLARQPRRLIIALQAYAMLALIRIAMMYCIPLEPPPGMIILSDPFVRAFSEGDNWAKDLFFSGHTSTTFLCALSLTKRIPRTICLAASTCVALFVLLQHAHYTIDVLVAPFISFGALHIAQTLSARILDDR